MNKETRIKGGEFLLKQTSPDNIFSSEDYTDEQKMFRTSMRDFLNKEIEPIKEKFDTKEGTKISPLLLEKMGDYGFHGIGVPEEYNGLNCDLKTEMAYGEIASDSFAFSQAIGVHTGLGIYPILFYGNKNQKDKYLKDIVSAKLKCSYCLTEPGSGSDANAAKTKAIYSDDKKYFILNGQKMWITNSGFADVFLVFCKIEDDKNLSCLIVHKEYGVKLGEEERKLGINGSSTRQVFFENIKVPVENLLGERNKGFKIAMNALNAGRLKIAVANSGIGKRAFMLGVNYSNEREQFDKKISEFGAIKEKIAKMGINLYALESTWNRIANDIDNANEDFKSTGMDALESKIKAVAEFSMECAMSKVYGSETETFIVDESLQIHGGMGFSAESEISVHYRNVRGNRIYEGTNEINRILIPTMLLRKAMKGELPFMQAAMSCFEELKSGKLYENTESKSIADLSLNFIGKCKKACLLTIGLAVQTFQEGLKDEQEVLMNLSDMLIQVYVTESAILRCIKHSGDENNIKYKLVNVLIYDTVDILKKSVKEVAFASCKENEALKNISGINKLFYLPAKNLKNIRREIANHFIAENKYKI